MSLKEKVKQGAIVTSVVVGAVSSLYAIDLLNAWSGGWGAADDLAVASLMFIAGFFTLVLGIMLFFKRTQKKMFGYMTMGALGATAIMLIVFMAVYRHGEDAINMVTFFAAIAAMLLLCWYLNFEKLAGKKRRKTVQTKSTETSSESK